MISLSAGLDRLQRKEAVGKAARSIMSLCSESGWHSYISALTPYREMMEMLYRMHSWEESLFVLGRGEAAGEAAATEAGKMALEDCLREEGCAKADKVLLHIETGKSVADGALPEQLRKTVDMLRSLFGGATQLLAHVSTVPSLGQKVLVTMMANVEEVDSFLCKEEEKARKMHPQETMGSWQEIQAQREKMLRDNDWNQ